MTDWTWPEALAAVAGSVAIAAAVVLWSLWVFGPRHDRVVLVPRGYATTLRPRMHVSTKVVYAPAPPPVTVYRPGPVRTVFIRGHGKPPPPHPDPTVTVTVTVPAPSPLPFSSP